MVKEQKTLGDRIRALRQGLRLNQKEFSDRVGVTQPTVSRWETDDDEPGVQHLNALAEMSRSVGNISPQYDSGLSLAHGVARTEVADFGELAIVHLHDTNRYFKEDSSTYLVDGPYRSDVGQIILHGDQQDTIGIIVPDESMSPYFKEHDVVIINLTDRNLEDGSVGLFMAHDEYGIWRGYLAIYRNQGPLRLEHMNPSPKRGTVMLEMPHKVLGRATLVISTLPKRIL